MKIYQNEIKNFTELKEKFHTINKKSINTKSYNVILINDHMEKNQNPTNLIENT